MATHYVYAQDLEEVHSTDPSQTPAATGPGDSIDPPATSTFTVGGSSTGEQYMQVFMNFDCSALPGTPTAANLELVGSTISGPATDFILEVRPYAWTSPLATGDFVAYTSLGGLTLLASWNTTGYVAQGARYTVPELSGALLAALEPTGLTGVFLSSSRQRLLTSWVTEEYTIIYGGYTLPADALKRPRLAITTTLAAASGGILIPAADVFVFDWRDASNVPWGANLYSHIDETSASDSDYVQSSPTPTAAEYYEVLLASATDPGVLTDHVAHYRYRKNVADGVVNLNVTLRQGASTGVASWAHSNIGSSWTQQDQTLSLAAPGTNVLDANTSGLETDATGWAVYTACTIAQSSAQARTGTKSLAVTHIAGQTYSAAEMTPHSAWPATPLVTYTITAWFRAATTARNCQIWFEFWTASFGRTGGGVQNSATNTTSGWTSVTVTATAPIDAAYHAPVFQINGVADGEVHYIDDVSIVAASITDYSDLRLRFTPSTTTDNSPIALVAERGDTAANSIDSDTSVINMSSAGSIAVGNYLIVRIAADNTGGGGAARTVTVTDTRSNTWTTLTQANRDPGAAGAGTTCSIAWCKVENAFTDNDDITITYSGSVPVDAYVVEEWTGIHSTTPVAVAEVTANGTGTALGAISITPTAAGQMVYVAGSVEGPTTDSFTQDSDTTQGTWVSLDRQGANVLDLAQTTCGGYKFVTGTSTQTWTATIASADWACVAVVFGAGLPTISTQVSWANLEIPEASGSPYTLTAADTRALADAVAVSGRSMSRAVGDAF